MFHAKSLAALLGTILLLPCPAAAADSVLFNPKIDTSSPVLLTGVEARFRFHRKQWDSSLTANLDEGNVGTTANVSNDVATLLNTDYSFSLSFSAQERLLTWTIMGGPLVDPNVMTVVETDSFNAIRFNIRTDNPSHVMTFSELAFDGLPGSGTLRSSGVAVNDIVGQRIVAASGLLSDSNWSITGKVSTTGTGDSKTKFWLAAQNVVLKAQPTEVDSGGLASMHPVPEAPSLFMMAGGLAWLGWKSRTRRANRRVPRTASHRPA